MKTYLRMLTLLMLWTLLLFVAVCAKAQTVTNTPLPRWAQPVWNSINPLFDATNYSFEPYLTYAPDIQAKVKVGGGILAIYNVNQYVGVGVGGDYLGRFTMLSANATLQYPMHPLMFTHSKFGTNFAVIPFQLMGAGYSLSGASTGGPGILIEDTGAAIQFGHLWGGTFNAGAAYGQWANAGSYSGKRYHIFAGWSKGF